VTADEWSMLTARIAALLDENNRLLRELASARAERDALERALAALERNQKREPGTKPDGESGNDHAQVFRVLNRFVPAIRFHPLLKKSGNR
jgi:hypothetical protein